MLVFPLAVFMLIGTILTSFMCIIASEQRRRGRKGALFVIDEESTAALGYIDQFSYMDQFCSMPVVEQKKEMKIHVA